jgi:hypothetical protein|tara:strand:+ start:199 stop:591 length:393 start_codon:yes stop_codon:yes gene_type:complete
MVSIVPLLSLTCVTLGMRQQSNSANKGITITMVNDILETIAVYAPPTQEGKYNPALWALYDWQMIESTKHRLACLAELATERSFASDDNGEDSAINMAQSFIETCPLHVPLHDTVCDEHGCYTGRIVLYL